MLLIGEGEYKTQKMFEDKEVHTCQLFTPTLELSLITQTVPTVTKGKLMSTGLDLAVILKLRLLLL